MQKVASLSAFPAAGLLGVKIGTTELLLVRSGATIRAYQGTCPHAGAPLAEGALCSGRIVCPWHKASFAASDGSLLEPPALNGLKPYAVTLQGDDILVGPLPPDPAEVGGKNSVAEDAAKTALIAGAGAAGTAAAFALRDFGWRGRILLVGQEAGLPYDRTELSKFVMSGEKEIAGVSSLREEALYAAQGIERVAAEIVALDVAAPCVRVAGGAVYGFDTALIATGGVPVRPKLPGVALRGVHVLRSRADAASMLADLRPGARVVIVGGSFIGLEAACGLRARGHTVTVVSPDAVPFARLFGSEIGLSLKTLHARHGVHFQDSGSAAALQGGDHVEAVVLEDGTRLAADMVLLGTGVRPATDFVQGVERDADGGLRVDAGMRLRGPVFAAGDIATFPLPQGGRTRIEHWRLAQQQARIAACNMAGGAALFEDVPFFWTYHYGKRYEYLGHAPTWDRVVTEGDIGRQDFVTLLCRRGMVAAAVACGRERQTAYLATRMRDPLNVEAALDVIRAAAQPRAA